MSDMDLQLIDELANLALQRARSTGVKCGFDTDGVQWLESYIEELRIQDVSELTNEDTAQLGAFFGKCILARYGGEWFMSEQGAAVSLPDGTVTFPMGRVKKQLEMGEFFSVRSLYISLASISSF